MKGKICLILVALFCMVTASTVVAKRMRPHGPGPEHGFGRIMHIAEKLELTGEQQATLRKHMKNTRKKVHPLLEQARDFHKLAVKITNSDSFNEDHVKTLLKLQSEVMCDVNLTMLKAMHEFRKNLTPQQIEKVTELIENHKGPGHHPKKGFHKKDDCRNLDSVKDCSRKSHSKESRPGKGRPGKGRPGKSRPGKSHPGKSHPSNDSLKDDDTKEN